jgi:hypothetical protein
MVISQKEAKKQAIKIVARSYFIRLTFKHSFRSRFRLIFKGLPLWNLRTRIFLVSVQQRMEKTAKRLIKSKLKEQGLRAEALKKEQEKKFKVLSEENLSPVDYLVAVRTVEDEIEHTKPTFH